PARRWSGWRHTWALSQRSSQRRSEAAITSRSAYAFPRSEPGKAAERGDKDRPRRKGKKESLSPAAHPSPQPSPRGRGSLLRRECRPLGEGGGQSAAAGEAVVEIAQRAPVLTEKALANAQDL